MKINETKISFIKKSIEIDKLPAKLNKKETRGRHKLSIPGMRVVTSLQMLQILK